MEDNNIKDKSVHLPGQGGRLHFWTIILFPIQLDPPFCAFVKIERRRVFSPVPHVAEHLPSLDQGPHSQLTV